MATVILEKRHTGLNLQDPGFDIAQYIQDHDLHFYSMVSSVPFVQYNYCMTAIASKLHTDGILVSGDSLELYAPKNKIIENCDDNFVKVRSITKHAVIGFSGANLNTSKFESYAEELTSLLKDFPDVLPKTLQNIAELVAQYLSQKIPHDNSLPYMLEAFVAGYSYDKGDKPVGEPHVYLIGNDFEPKLELHNYSGVGSGMRALYKPIAQKIIGYDIDAIDSIEQTTAQLDKTLFAVSNFEKGGYLNSGHIGGKIRRWNITKTGIDPSFGDELPVYAQKGKHI